LTVHDEVDLLKDEQFDGFWFPELYPFRQLLERWFALCITELIPSRKNKQVV